MFLFEITADISIGAAVVFEGKSCKPDGCKLQAVLQEDSSGDPLSERGKEEVSSFSPQFT